MAFQPILDLETGRPFAYEALARGRNGEGAASVLGQVTSENRYAFDQRCRVKAIETAVAAGILETGARLSINFLPNAVYSPRACIQLTLKTASATGFPADRLIFEFTEQEEIVDAEHVAEIVRKYREMGFGTALDDFGAGHAGLGLLARFQPDLIKLDMELVRGIDSSLPRRVIVESVAAMCRGLGITLIAEGRGDGSGAGGPATDRDPLRPGLPDRPPRLRGASRGRRRNESGHAPPDRPSPSCRACFSIQSGDGRGARPGP
jgi:EAL domain-containing protein (putative c-di-GMP-specific phosphodiesterase class I)